MKTINAYIKKEFIESVRQYKYLIIGAGILIFAVLDPIMLKMLPKILKSQTQYNLESILSEVTIKMGMQNYIKDLFQISIMFVVFITASSLQEEVSKRKLVFPYMKGASAGGIVISKFFSYSISTIICLFAGMMLNYYYNNILFNSGHVAFSTVIKNAMLISLYFLFNIALSMMAGLIIRKSFVSDIIVLAVGYVSAAFSSVKSVVKYLPYNLIACSSSMNYDNIAYSIVSSTAILILILFISIKYIKKVEII